MNGTVTFENQKHAAKRQIGLVVVGIFPYLVNTSQTKHFFYDKGVHCIAVILVIGFIKLSFLRAFYNLFAKEDNALVRGISA